MNALRRSCTVGRTALGVACLAAAAFAQDTSRLSTDSSGNEANDRSFDAALSQDGLVVAFDSFASNLVSPDVGGFYDIFVKDRTTGLTEMESVSSTGVQGNADSLLPFISPDGRFVVFSSLAKNLVASDTNGKYDVFLRDRLMGTTERVSIRGAGVQANDDSFALGVSADGNIVYFESNATNLIGSDTNASGDVFIRNRSAAKTTRVSVDSSGNEGNSFSWFGGMATDASAVCFYSAATNLISNDFNSKNDVYLHDLNTGITSRVSADPSGNDANGPSILPRMSSDGRFIVYRSGANNLVANDTNGFVDAFVFDRASGLNDRVSIDSYGNESNNDSFTVPNPGGVAIQTYGGISTDGQFVIFDSQASNLVDNDTNGVTDVFIHNRYTGLTQRVSVDSTGAESNDVALIGTMSNDGSFAAFQSIATNLVAGDTNGASDVFGHERCQIQASWYNYGTGFPGTFGVPSLTAQSPPSFASNLTIDVGNSSGQSAVGVLFVGFVQTSIHSSWGGDLVVIPFLTVSIPVPPTGLPLSGTIPNQETLCGFTIDMQAIESDPGALKGVAFTPGIALTLGY
jgi:WD40 repeat protein